MSAFLNDLSQAFQLFQQGTQSLKLQRTLTQANEQVAQIRSSELSDADQRQQLRQLGEQTAIELFAGGIDPARVLGAQQAISPGPSFEEKLQMEEASKLRVFAGQQALKAPQPLQKEDRDRFIAGRGFAVNKAAADDYRQIKSELAPAIASVDALVSLNEELAKPGGSLDFETRAKADPLQKTLIGLLRVPITGPGAFTESEKTLIEETIGDVTSRFSIASLNETRLNQIKKILQKKVKIIDNSAGFVSDPTSLPAFPQEARVERRSEIQKRGRRL